MSSSKRNLTRRRFLQGSALGVGALLFADQAIHSLAERRFSETGKYFKHNETIL
jgi:hypothetical protein